MYKCNYTYKSFYNKDQGRILQDNYLKALGKIIAPLDKLYTLMFIIYFTGNYLFVHLV